MNQNLAPIVLFVYNRPWHTEQTLHALMKNELADQSVLYIYADGPKENATQEQLKKIKGVRELIKSKKWCKEVNIIESEKNKGLADSVIYGVTKIVNEFEKIIVLEDDLITGNYFLSYMNTALTKYEKDDIVMHISGFNFPLSGVNDENSSFFLAFASSWGWATWKKSWKLFDPIATGYEVLKTDKNLTCRFNINQTYPYTAMLLNQIESKLIDSWAIRWWWSVFINQGLSLFPDKTLIENIGYDMDATHTKEINHYGIDKINLQYQIINYPQVIIENSSMALKLQQYLRTIEKKKKTPTGFGRSAYNKIKSFFSN